jgi:hypothetical protein
LNAIANERLVRVSEADLVRNKQAMIPGERADDREPIFFAAAKAVNQNDNGAGAYVPIMDSLPEDGNRLFRGHGLGGLRECRASDDCKQEKEGNET